MFTLNIICIVYQKTIHEIKSMKVFQSFVSNFRNAKLFIYDNSEDEKIRERNFHLSKTLKVPDVFYVSNGGNAGLSKSYNKALRSIRDKEQWLMWADDDSDFSLEYLENVYAEAQKGKYRIITGIIKNQSGSVLSPKKNNFVKIRSDAGDFIDKLGIYKDLYCINSGLAVKRSLYDKIGEYNETLFLDMVDFWFFDEVIKRNICKIRVVDGEILQNHSGDPANNKSPDRKRLESYNRDFHRYCTIENKSIAYRYILAKKHEMKVRLFIIIGYMRGIFHRNEDS